MEYRGSNWISGVLGPFTNSLWVVFVPDVSPGLDWIMALDCGSTCQGHCTEGSSSISRTNLAGKLLPAWDTNFQPGSKAGKTKYIPSTLLFPWWCSDAAPWVQHCLRWPRAVTEERLKYWDLMKWHKSDLFLWDFGNKDRQGRGWNRVRCCNSRGTKLFGWTLGIPVSTVHLCWDFQRAQPGFPHFFKGEVTAGILGEEQGWGYCLPDKADPTSELEGSGLRVLPETMAACPGFIHRSMRALYPPAFPGLAVFLGLCITWCVRAWAEPRWFFIPRGPSCQQASLNLSFLSLIPLLILYSLETYTHLGNPGSCWINRGKFPFLKLALL